MDGDGDLDALIGSQRGWEFAENTGSPSAFAFGWATADPFGLADIQSDPAPALVDIDGDGDLDVFAGDGGGRIQFLENTGTTSTPAFAAPVTAAFGLTSVSGSAVPAFADLDADGLIDVVVGDWDGDLTYFRNTGASTSPAFGPPVTNGFGLSATSESARPDLVDVDSDGDFDLFVGTYGGQTVFFENVGNATAPAFAAPVKDPFGLQDVGHQAAPALVDIDGDGDLDAVYGRDEYYEPLVLFWNRGTATAPRFDAPTPDIDTPFGLPDFEYESAPAFGDLDGDGDLDAVIGSYRGELLVMENGGTPKAPLFAAGNPFGVRGHDYDPDVTFADIDGDGDLDVFIVGSRSYEILFHENTGAPAAPKLAPVSTNPFGWSDVGFTAELSFADIDGDGDLDGFVGLYGGTRFYENTGTHTSPAFGAPIADPFGLVAVGGDARHSFVDIDDDGDLDGLIGRDFGTVLFTNTGTPSAPLFAPPQTVPFGLWCACRDFVDIDGDGDLDGVEGSNQDTVVCENTGTPAAPAFGPPQMNPFGLEPVGDRAAPTLADFDGDGDLDAFVAARYGVVAFFENTGSETSPEFSGEFNEPFLPVSTTDVWYAGPALADIDADGDLDLLVGDGQGRVLYFENTGTPTAPAFAPDSPNPFGLTSVDSDARLGLGDIDGDGDLDLFVGEDTGQTIWFENVGTPSAPAFGAPVANPFGLTTVDNDAAPELVDIDEDGDLDLFSGQHDGTLVYFENTGTVSAPAFAAARANPFGIGEIVDRHTMPRFVDIDGDGDLDFFSGAYDGEMVFSRNGPPSAPLSGVDAFLEYKVKESARTAPNGALFTSDCNLTLDDPLFDFGDGLSTAENYRASLARTIGLAAATAGVSSFDEGNARLLGLLIRGAGKGALPVENGKFPKARSHERRFGVLVTIPHANLHDGSGANTLRLDTKKVTRLLVPATTAVGTPPTAEPGQDQDSYKCYKTKASTSGGVGTLQDTKGKELRGIQVLVEDDFDDGQAHPRFGNGRLFDLGKASELCNPVALSPVDTTEQDAKGARRSSDCAVAESAAVRPATSLLCWRVRAARAEMPQPIGTGVPSSINPRQEKHERRRLSTASAVHVTHSLVAPDRVDTSKEQHLCLPVHITDPGFTKP